MAAGHIYSTEFDSTTFLAKTNNGKHVLGGAFMDSVTLTIPVTTLDDENDHANMIVVPHGLTIRGLHIECAALAASNLDFDAILRDPDAALTDAPNSTLWNAGTAFTSAVSKYIALATPVLVPKFAKGYGIVGFVVNVAGGTPAEAALTLTVFGT
jgi:hypothetical protein